MVRTVVGEETHLSSFEAQLSQSGLSAQVGLVIGKITTGSDRGAVYGLVPTPLNDNGEPASLISSGRDDKKRNLKQPKSQQESSSLLIDSDWVAEHARQVSKMLLGGIHVVGVYVWVGESLFKCSSLLLWLTVKAVAAVAPICGGVNLEERILLHMSYSPRRWSCRSCLLGSNFSSTSLRLCDFKLSKIVSGLQTFRCNYSFEIRELNERLMPLSMKGIFENRLNADTPSILPIFAEDMVDSLNFRDVLTRGISCHAQHLKNAKALVDGNLVTGDQLSASGNPHEIELLLPFLEDNSMEACSTKEVAGLLVLYGSIYASGHLGPKEPVSQAVSDIKGDIITSLRSRLDIICDEAEQYSGSNSEGGGSPFDGKSSSNSLNPLFLHEWRQPSNLPFPRRVLFPWIEGIFICDYLQPSESFEDVKVHGKELMSMEDEINPSDILEVEIKGPTLAMRPFWDVVSCNSLAELEERRRKSKDVSSTGTGGQRVTNHSNLNLLAALAILLLAILIGVGMILSGPKSI